MVVVAAPAVGVTEAGENWKVRPAGSPEALKVTGALNPLAGATWICTVPEAPAASVSVGTEAAT